MVCIGEDQTYTAMAKNSWFTGCLKLILNGKITTPGVQLPIQRSVSTALKELEEYGVVFEEQSMTYYGYKVRQHLVDTSFVIPNPIR
jgi:hypothetical protein